MAILSKGCKPDNFEPHDALKLSFTNIWGLCWMWSFRWIQLSWHSCSMWDNLGWLNWFWQIFCGGYLPLIQKDSTTHMHGLAVYLKEGIPFARDLSLENLADSNLCFRLALLHSVSYFFFLYRSPSPSLCTVFDSIWSNIDKILSINPSANEFVFGDFNVHHEDWLTYSGGTDRPGELCYNFSISYDLA